MLAQEQAMKMAIDDEPHVRKASNFSLVSFNRRVLQMLALRLSFLLCDARTQESMEAGSSISFGSLAAFRM